MALHLLILFISTVLATQQSSSRLDEDSKPFVVTRKQRNLLFPDGSTMGLFLAATIPLEKRDEITLVWFFEANYHVPEYSLDFFSGNETSRMSRDLDRRRIYVMLENAFYRYGYDGRECLLKCICETSNTPLHNKTGLLGDLLRILFTPSSSLDEELSPAFQVAEERGRNHEACDHAYPNCSIGLMDISTIL